VPLLVLTRAERRGAVMLLVLYALGAGWDAWRAHRPMPTAADLAARVPIPTDTAAVGAGGGRSPEPRRMESGQGPLVDLNRADARALDALPGIGPVLAGRIVEYRRRVGRFRTAEELLGVRGIGPALFERLRARVAVSRDSLAATGPGR
jgi:competence protein ComEA